MADPGKTVFLSYRRQISWALAQAVRGDLARHGFDVFMDTTGLDGGEFEQTLLAEVVGRAHFVVLLEPGSLEGIADPDDWLRREVAAALATGRNVVPVTARGLTMPDARDLPSDIARLASFNALTIPPDYVNEALHRLRDRFLHSDPGQPSGRPDLSVRFRWADEPGGRMTRRGYFEVRWSPVRYARAYLLQEDFLGGGRTWRDVHCGRETRYRSGAASYRPAFRVCALDGGVWSDVVRAPDVGPNDGYAMDLDFTPRLRCPTLATRRAGLTLSWTAVPSATAYVVQRVGRPELVRESLLEEIYRGNERRIAYQPPRTDWIPLRTDWYRARALFAPDEVGPWGSLRRSRVIG